MKILTKFFAFSNLKLNCTNLPFRHLIFPFVESWEGSGVFIPSSEDWWFFGWFIQPSSVHSPCTSTATMWSSLSSTSVVHWWVIMHKNDLGRLKRFATYIHTSFCRTILHLISQYGYLLCMYVVNCSICCVEPSSKFRFFGFSHFLKNSP